MSLVKFYGCTPSSFGGAKMYGRIFVLTDRTLLNILVYVEFLFEFFEARIHLCHHISN